MRVRYIILTHISHLYCDTLVGLPLDERESLSYSLSMRVRHEPHMLASLTCCTSLELMSTRVWMCVCLCIVTHTHKFGADTNLELMIYGLWMTLDENMKGWLCGGAVPLRYRVRCWLLQPDF